MAESDSDERLRLTPEQRRFLGGSRPVNPQPTTEQKISKPEPVAKAKTAPPVPPRPPESSHPPEQRAPRRSRRWRFSKVLEVQRLALVAGALILLGATFYVGKKFEYWRYLIATRNEAKIAAKATRSEEHTSELQSP